MADHYRERERERGAVGSAYLILLDIYSGVMHLAENYT